MIVQSKRYGLILVDQNLIYKMALNWRIRESCPAMRSMPVQPDDIRPHSSSPFLPAMIMTSTLSAYSICLPEKFLHPKPSAMRLPTRTLGPAPSGTNTKTNKCSFYPRKIYKKEGQSGDETIYVHSKQMQPKGEGETCLGQPPVMQGDTQCSL